MFKILKTVLPALIITPLLLITSCASPNNRDTGSAQKLRAAVSFDALYELTLAVGGERVSVTKIIPDGTEAHDFELKAKDLSALSETELLIINGLGMEPWSEAAAAASGNGALVVTDASAGIEPIALPDDGDTDHDDHHHSSYDPHIWLSPKCAAVMADNIRGALTAADPDGADYYRTNCDEFTARLDALFDEYTVKFRVAERNTIVTGHAVFAYLCRDFSLEQNSVTGVFAEGEPSARALAELINYCRENNVTTILAEYGSSTDISETLAREAGASTAVIYTLESAEDGKPFLDRIAYNLEVIWRSLGS